MVKSLIFTSRDAAFKGPKLYADPRLTDGSLVLIDATSTVAPWPSGVPTTIPNIAAQEAAALLGGDAGVDLAVQNTISAASGKVERSGKGGLHVAMKRTGTVENESILLNLSTQVLVYLDANPTHAMYFSVWGRATRARTIGSGPSAIPLGGLRREHATVHTPWLNTYYASSSGNVATNPGPGLGNYINRTVGTLTSGAGDFRVVIGASYRDAATWGSSVLSPRLVELGNTMTGVANFAPSTILYAAQLVDLTVTAAQLGGSVVDAYNAVDARDAAEYAAAFGTGGRYSADTFTDPTTL